MSLSCPSSRSPFCVYVSRKCKDMIVTVREKSSETVSIFTKYFLYFGFVYILEYIVYILYFTLIGITNCTRTKLVGERITLILRFSSFEAIFVEFSMSRTFFYSLQKTHCSTFVRYIVPVTTKKDIRNDPTIYMRVILRRIILFLILKH